MRHRLSAPFEITTEILQRYGPESPIPPWLPMSWSTATCAATLTMGSGFSHAAICAESGRHNPRRCGWCETESALLLDGDRAGVIPGMQAIRWCVERAQSRDSVRCSAQRRYCNTLAPYVSWQPSRCHRIACVNAEPAVAPPGGSTKVFGTNPLAFGVPAGRHFPLIFDTATSSTAALKMRIAALKGEKVPEGLIVDEKGRPTTEPREFWPPGGGGPIGSILPLGWPVGSHKGFGLAMVVDVLAGVLTGGGFAQTAHRGQRHRPVYWALDISPFMALEKFRARVDEQIDQVKSSARAERGGIVQEKGPTLRDLFWRTVPIPDESWSGSKRCVAIWGSLPDDPRTTLVTIRGAKLRRLMQ